jgi:predicted DNA-binding protein (MmcQ/YjbR family)
MKASPPDRRLAHLADICLALPGAVRLDCGQHACFQVRRRTFAWFLNDHHGDGIVAVACKVLPGDNARLSAANPARFYLPPYVGPKGWVALRLDAGAIDWREVAELVSGSYALVTPRRPRRVAPQE